MYNSQSIPDFVVPYSLGLVYLGVFVVVALAGNTAAGTSPTWQLTIAFEFSVTTT